MSPEDPIKSCENTAKSEGIVKPAAIQMRSPVGESQCRNIEWERSRVGENEWEKATGCVVYPGDKVERRSSADDGRRTQAFTCGWRWAKKSSGVGIVISEEICKEVDRVERWNGLIIMAWATIRKQLVCVMNVYGPHTGWTKAGKQEFRDALEMMIGMVELETLLCIAGYFNTHIGETEPGEEENIGNNGWGQ